jgi:hypothetical protein
MKRVSSFSSIVRAAGLSAPSLAAVLVMAWTAPAFAQQPEPAVPPSNEPAPAPANDEPTAAMVASPLPWSSSSPAVMPDRPAAEGPPRYDLVRVNVGFRVGYVPGRAFDTFASNDVLSQFSIDGTYPLLTRGKLVLGAGLGWDFGGRSDQLRGFTASLATHRLYVPIEGRWHFAPGFSAFGKVSPGAVAALTSVEDPSASNELSSTGWAFSADASIGASILMGPRKHMDKRAVRFWLTPEIGYAFTTRAPVHQNPGRDEKDLLGSDENTNLRSLALAGFFWRASVGTTF